jgi:hypothetical protein
VQYLPSQKLLDIMWHNCVKKKLTEVGGGNYLIMKNTLIKR